MESVLPCLGFTQKSSALKGEAVASPVLQETLVSANKSVIQFPTCRILYRGLVESEFMGRAEFVCLGRGAGGVRWYGGT